MKITFDWLKDHLKTNLKEKNLLDQLTNIGLEVESVQNLFPGNEIFKVAKIIKTEKHPNADRLQVCNVDVGEKELKKVVCGASNAKKGLITIYAPPRAVIPKTKTKLTPKQTYRFIITSDLNSVDGLAMDEQVFEFETKSTKSP